jgi:small subunit ribosomal protein S15
MALTVKAKKEIKKDYGRHERDTGSSEVQIALLTERINKLTEHMAGNKKDHHSRRNLILLVSRRQKLLNYLKKADPEGYQNLVKKLGLRR